MPLAQQRTAWRDWTAIAAAYLLVLQILAVGLAAGAQAAMQGADASGIICTTSQASKSQAPGAPGPDGGRPAGHDGPDCCVMGCPMFTPAAAPPPAIGGITTPAMRPALAIRMRGEPRLVSDQRHSPGLARAPPVAA